MSLSGPGPSTVFHRHPSPNDSSHMYYDQDSMSSEHKSFFPQAHDFVLHNPILVSNAHHHIDVDDSGSIKHLLDHTVLGAIHDSSERDPPPRCHPETRVALRKNLMDWARSQEAEEKPFVWLNGPAGVGKSAIMQTVAESLFSESQENPITGASFFFWKTDPTVKRNNYRQLFTTIAYQLCTCNPPYKKYLLSELVRDPKLPERAIQTQFHHFIVKPFVNLKLHSGPDSQPFIIIIDGLDECKSEREQCELVRLIASFVVEYPKAPLLWLVSSRPESHLEAMFARKDISAVHERKEVPINSDDAWEEIEIYLRSEFDQIRIDFPFAMPMNEQWPSESQFLDIVCASDGLYAFAATVIEFIKDYEFQDPVSLLNEVVDAIGYRKDNPLKENPFANLDVLYSLIMSTIPKGILPTTMRVLRFIIYPAMLDDSMPLNRPVYLLDFLGLTTRQGHSSLHKLSGPILQLNFQDFPEQFYFHHQSFSDFLVDKSRSGEYHIGSEQDAAEDKMLIIRQTLQRATGSDGVANIANIKLTSDMSRVLNVKAQAGFKVILLMHLHNHLMHWCCRSLSPYHPLFSTLKEFTRAFDFVGSSEYLNSNAKPSGYILAMLHNFRVLLLLLEGQDSSIYQKTTLGSINMDQIDMSRPTSVLVQRMEFVMNFTFDDRFGFGQEGNDDPTLHETDENREWYNRYVMMQGAIEYLNLDKMGVFLNRLRRQIKSSPNRRVMLLGLENRCYIYVYALDVLNPSTALTSTWSLLIPYIKNIE